jgi:hypothetical protein
MRQKERSERNQRVVLMRITQVPVKDIAEMMGLTDRQIRRIMANRSRSRDSSPDPRDHP